MPLEISEIGIRLAVAEPSASASIGARAAGADGARLSPQQVEELVNLCVHEVLRTLRMLEER